MAYMATDPEAELRAARPREALRLLEDRVRRKPGDLASRSRLFQVLCLTGEWDRARAQVDLLADFAAADDDLMLAAPAYARLIECERVRHAVFAGRRTPTILGQPDEWIGVLVEALRLRAEGKTKDADQLQLKALNAAPASSGRLDGKPFAWIADADSRFGPTLEVILDGQYYWAPIGHIRRIVIAPPASLHDRVWLPAQFDWTNDGQTQGYLPVRYPGTEFADDGGLLMAQAVAWEQGREGLIRGLGQRVLATDEADHALLKVRCIEVDPAAG